MAVGVESFVEADPRRSLCRKQHKSLDARRSATGARKRKKKYREPASGASLCAAP